MGSVTGSARPGSRGSYAFPLPRPAPSLSPYRTLSFFLLQHLTLKPSHICGGFKVLCLLMSVRESLLYWGCKIQGHSEEVFLEWKFYREKWSPHLYIPSFSLFNLSGKYLSHVYMARNCARAGDSKVTKVCPCVSSAQGHREASKWMT